MMTSPKILIFIPDNDVDTDAKKDLYNENQVNDDEEISEKEEEEV